MQHIPDVTKDSLIPFVTDVVQPGATVHTDGWPAYMTVGQYGFEHVRTVMRQQSDPAHVVMPGVHRVASLLKRWLLGTHQGSVDPAHLQAYLDEFVFRFNRRRSRSRGLVFYRVLELAVGHEPVRYRDLVVDPQPKEHPPAGQAGWGHPPSLDRPPANHPWRAA